MIEMEEAFRRLRRKLSDLLHRKSVVLPPSDDSNACHAVTTKADTKNDGGQIATSSHNPEVLPFDIRMISSHEFSKIDKQDLTCLSDHNTGIIALVDSIVKSMSVAGLIASQSQYAIIDMGKDASGKAIDAAKACLSRTDGSGFTLTRLDESGNFVNGSWMPAGITPAIAGAAVLQVATVVVGQMSTVSCLYSKGTAVVFLDRFSMLPMEGST